MNAGHMAAPITPRVAHLCSAPVVRDRAALDRRSWRTPPPPAVARRNNRWGRPPACDTSWQPDSPPSLARRTRTSRSGPVGLPGEEGGGFFRISRSSRKMRFSLRRRPNSSRSSVVSPPRKPASISCCRAQSRSESTDTPRSRATCTPGLPLSLKRRTASVLNSTGYGGLVFGMVNSSPGATTESQSVHQTGSTPSLGQTRAVRSSRRPLCAPERAWYSGKGQRGRSAIARGHAVETERPCERRIPQSRRGQPSPALY